MSRSYILNSQSKQKAARSARRKMVAFLMSTVLPTSSLFIVPAASADSISESAPIYSERVEGSPPEFYEALDNAYDRRLNTGRFLCPAVTS